MNFSKKTRALLEKSSNGRIAIGAFEKEYPSVSSQIRADAKSTWLAAWGQSLNFDEHEKQRIVDPKLLTTIGRLSKVAIREQDRYHAGLTHTYGYLFSLLKTRYGFKRERWTSGVIARGLGLPAHLISPNPQSGTLLLNVTWLLTRIAFSRSQQRSFFKETLVPSELATLDFKRLKIQRLEEKIPVTRSRKLRNRVTSIFSDLVTFPKPQKENSVLLIYSYRFGNEQKLISCFPISATACEEILNQPFGSSVRIRPRYNAHIPGAKAVSSGSRSVRTLKL